MKAERHDEKFFDDLRDRLDQAADDLSPDIRRRLAQARARALETPAWKRFIIPAGGPGRCRQPGPDRGGRSE